jgi:hypothetical protein
MARDEERHDVRLELQEATIEGIQGAILAGRSRPPSWFAATWLGSRRRTAPAPRRTPSSRPTLTPAWRGRRGKIEHSPTGASSPGHGIPVAVKEHTLTADMPTTFGSVA